jgi:dTDP-4-amino-4,6-dideoxygalactose transaminase
LKTYNMMDYTKMETSLYDDCQIIVQVHFAGLPDICSTGCFIIEDACHALGARYESGEMVGCGRFSEMTCFSFHPAKTITTGEGGAVTSMNGDYIREIKRLRDHGTENIGFNYRMTDFQAALGISQLKRIDGFIRRRKEIFRRYNEESGGEWGTPQYDECSACNLYVAWFDDNMVMLERLGKKSIVAQLHYRPVYRQRWYWEKREPSPNAEEYSKHALTLPLYPAMTDEDVEYVIKTVKECL